jgi:hypothetical protein
LIHYIKTRFNCTLNIRFYNIATAFGYIGMLEYAKKYNCPKIDIDDIDLTEGSVCKTAVAHGHLGCFKWLIDNGFRYNAQECINSANNNEFVFIATYIGNLPPQQNDDNMVVEDVEDFEDL